MKKIIILFFTLFLIGTTFAQDKKLYISLGPGVGIGTARSYDLYHDNSNSKAYPVGLGKELNINLRAGFVLNSYVAVELGVVYHNGFNTRFDIVNFYSFKSTDVSTGTGTIKFSGSMLQLVPAVVIRPKLGNDKIQPYARLGIIVGILPSISSKLDFTETSTPDVKMTSSANSYSTAFKYSGSIAVGGSAAVGCDYKLTDLLSIYAELYYDGLSYAPSKGKYTKFTMNGADQLAGMTTQQKEISFVKDRTGYTPSSGTASQQVKNSYPFNSLGLNLGVKISL